MPVDLLWNGGIGTYVKASDETQRRGGRPHQRRAARQWQGVACQSGRRRRQSRADAARAGRVRAARRPAQTDFIDNSAGVNTSDVEVNIKILLNPDARGQARARRPQSAVGAHDQ